MALKLNSYQLRHDPSPRQKDQLKKQPIYILLDDVLDTYNIGSVFRLADAVAAEKVILTGRSAIPPNPRIKKASINTTEWVDWEYIENPVKAIENLKLTIDSLQVVAIELAKNSVPYDKFDYQLPVCLIVGNETTGVTKEVLDLCDAVVELPMFGVNISLNVMVSLAIVLYQVIENSVK